MAEILMKLTGAGRLVLCVVAVIAVPSISEASNCSWGGWTTGCGANCLQERECLCEGGNSSTSVGCVGQSNRSCCTSGTPSQTTPTRLSPTSTMTAETVFTDRAEVSMTTFSMTTFSMTTEENAVIATDPASGSDGGSNAKTLIAVIAPIGSIVFIAVLAGLLFVIWKRRKSSVITVTRPIPADKRRKFQKVSEPDSPI